MPTFIVNGDYIEDNLTRTVKNLRAAKAKASQLSNIAVYEKYNLIYPYCRVTNSYPNGNGYAEMERERREAKIYLKAEDNRCYERRFRASGIFWIEVFNAEQKPSFQTKEDTSGRILNRIVDDLALLVKSLLGDKK